MLDGNDEELVVIVAKGEQSLEVRVGSKKEGVGEADLDAFVAPNFREECSVLAIGSYSYPYIKITQESVHFSCSPEVERIQLRHVQSGAINLYGAGPARVHPGEYVLSLHGQTTGRSPVIRACIRYN